MRILGLDVGEKTIGVAVSDALHFTAQGIETISWDEHAGFEQILPKMEAIIKEHEISKAVVGLPKHMNGTIGDRGEASKRFATFLENELGIKTVLWDERLTSMAAERVLLEADMSRKKRKKVIDKMAAVLILQGYLDQSN
ncbi:MULTISPECIES: Holliday junction resolvase RuvX [Allobacillus]|uniref:Putative pre-16S rRNA nuclease n=1 Tax=Allobacillus salarius TaxID=1955272 RepID=A0A556PTU3_9BACI|nr:Holliday junction resolvase RuvX [Allobacillus salarius]TSJ67793.1 Holliday junction resolvase RuvX [Allobacillus salarius]